VLGIRDCNWDYGLWDKEYEMIKIKKLETRGDKLRLGDWVMDYGV